jgi:hypothetical protein
MGKQIGLVVIALVALGCAGWQKKQVKATVVDELECPAEHVVAKGPFAPSAEDGPVKLSDDERLFRGACSLAWDERVVVACDRSNKTCRVLDVGPPRLEPKSVPHDTAAEADRNLL